MSAKGGMAEHVVTEGPSRCCDQLLRVNPITLRFRLGPWLAVFECGAGDRSRTRTILLTRQPLNRIELHRHVWGPALESNQGGELRGLAGDPPREATA